MGLFKKEKMFDCRFTGKIVETTGTSIIPHGIFLTVSLKGDIITIDNSDVSFQLQRPQITSTGYFTEQDIIVKNKSVVGRSVAGALMFGQMGAIIGGLSGVGNKQTKTYKKFVFIEYQSKEGANCGLVFLIENYELQAALKFVEMTRLKATAPIEL